jgi:hypothetical protein
MVFRTSASAPVPDYSLLNPVRTDIGLPIRHDLSRTRISRSCQYTCVQAESSRSARGEDQECSRDGKVLQEHEYLDLVGEVVVKQ